MTDITVRSLHVYPIKSTSAVDLGTAMVRAAGLDWDRRWMLVGSDNEVITAREYPRLLEIQTEVSGTGLLVRHAGTEQFTLSLVAGEEESGVVTVFGSPASGVTVDRHVDEWFSGLIGTSCRLVFMGSGRREVSPKHGGRAGDVVSYADQCPLLLISRASLEDLNKRLETPVSMRNFRPNIVVDGCGPYAEDDWTRIEIGGLAFDVAQQCQRCVFTTIDPGTGDRHPRQEPLRTLSKFHRHPDGGAAFGVHLIPRDEGTLSIGYGLALT